MARATISTVKDLYGDSGASDSEINAAIDVANILVDTRIKGKSGTTDALLLKIEELLAAHFLVINKEKGGLKREQIGDATEAYAFDPGKGLSATRYGQQALTLDPTGILAQVGKKRAVIKMFPRELE